MVLNNLQKRIVATIAYFDLFDYPLTSVEVWRWLYCSEDESTAQKVELAAVIDNLQSAGLQPIIDVRNGFYFLLGRREIVLTRLNRYGLAKKKFRAVLGPVAWLRAVPFVQLAAVCNNVGYGNGSKESDIDFFIITKSGRLWLTRLLVTLLIQILGRRRHGKKIINRICLSFYTSEDRLNLFDLGLKPADPYLAYWLATLASVYNRQNSYQNFLSANQWLANYLPNFYPVILNEQRQSKSNWGLDFLRSSLELCLSGFFGRWLERLAKFFQVGRIRRYAGAAGNQKTTDVVISDEMLKLHTTDRRQYYRQLWLEKINQLIA